MDISEEIDVFLSACNLTQDESSNLVFSGKTGCFESKYLADWFINQINFGWKLWQAAKDQAVLANKQFNLDEFLSMEEKLKSKGGIIKADLESFIAYAEMVLEKAKVHRSQNDH